MRLLGITIYTMGMGFAALTAYMMLSAGPGFPAKWVVFCALWFLVATAGFVIALIGERPK